MRTATRTLTAALGGTLLLGTMLSGPAFAGEDAASGTLSEESVAEIKAASDPDPFTAQEIEAAHAESAAKDAKTGFSTMDLPTPPPASAYLTANHVAQAYSNYCGPATARMTLLHQGKNYSQATLASRFGITPGIAGNVWEVVGGPHLPGHPNREIFHWVNIRGYKESGSYSQVQDPATSVWSGVPAQSPVYSNTLVTMMGGRGYQW